MARLRRAVLVGLGVVVGACGGDSGAGGAAGGREVVLRDVGCKSCRIVTESIAFLGHPDDTVSFREDVLPARDSRGRFYLADRTGAVVDVFGPDGRLMKTFGKAGRGPGEFAGLRAVFVAPGDTLLVVGGAVVHVLTPEYVQVREYRNMAGSIDELAGTLLADGRLVHERANHQFTLIDSTGKASPNVVLRDIDTSPCGECGERIYREASTPGSIWSGPLNTYRVENHDLSGLLLRRFVREVSWYPPWGLREIQAPDIVVELGRPRLVGVRQGGDGIVWTHVTLIEHPDDLRNIDEDVPRQMARVWSRIVTKVEAIDPVKGQLLGGVTLTNMVLPLRGDYSAQLIVNESGDWAWKILRFHVEGQQ